MLKIEFVEKRVVISGQIVEIFEYEVGYNKGYTLSERQTANRGCFSGEENPNYDLYRKQSLQRAKASLMRLINANVYKYGRDTPKFLTLTFAENITDLDIGHYEFEKFIKRLNYEVLKTKKNKLKYSCVVEFQKRGAIHYHVVFYNLPYINANIVKDCWGNGFIKINKINDVDNLGAYVTKYMTKDNDDERLQGRRSYFNSRGLFKPQEITDKKRVEQLAVALPSRDMKFTATYQSDQLGSISYKQYNLSPEGLQILKNGGRENAC